MRAKSGEGIRPASFGADRDKVRVQERAAGSVIVSSEERTYIEPVLERRSIPSGMSNFQSDQAEGRAGTPSFA